MNSEDAQILASDSGEPSLAYQLKQLARLITSRDFTEEVYRRIRVMTALAAALAEEILLGSSETTGFPDAADPHQRHASIKERMIATWRREFQADLKLV